MTFAAAFNCVGFNEKRYCQFIQLTVPLLTLVTYHSCDSTLSLPAHEGLKFSIFVGIVNMTDMGMKFGVANGCQFIVRNEELILWNACSVCIVHYYHLHFRIPL